MLIDAYRLLVLANFAACEGESGQSAKALLDQTKDLDPKLVEASARYLSTRYADDAEAWGHQDAAIWDDFAAFLLDAGLIDKPIEVDDAWTNQYLPKP